MVAHLVQQALQADHQASEAREMAVREQCAQHVITPFSVPDATVLSGHTAHQSAALLLRVMCVLRCVPRNCCSD